MQTYSQILDDARQRVIEKHPWEIQSLLETEHDCLLLDVREVEEYSILRISDSINVPRGVLESACEYDFEETHPELAESRDRRVVVICRSGYRSLLAADVMQSMGYNKVVSLKTGIRGWNDAEQALIDGTNQLLDPERADEILTVELHPEQLSKNRLC